MHLPIVALNNPSFIHESRRLTLAACVIEGMGLAKKMDDDLGGLIYTGPSHVYPQFQRSQFEKYQSEFNLKHLSIGLKKLAVQEKHLYPIKPPVFETKSVPTLDDLPPELKDDPKIQRAILNINKVCQCGSTKFVPSKITVNQSGRRPHVRDKVHVGGRRKMRCRKCSGCTAEPCRQCAPCTKPTLKKPCVLRTCKYPIPPQCPCFI